MSEQAVYNTKINETEKSHHKYITTQEFNNLTSKNVTARLARAKLVIETNIADFVKITDFDDKNLFKKSYFK